jgi:hypothetical protein
MKIRKTVTAAKAAANKKNAQEKSTGPRTAAGKSAACRNAIRLGFFARELVLNDGEKRKLNGSARILRSQLSPQTELQEICFALIVACIGRCKVALKQEMGQVIKAGVLGEPTAPPVRGASEDPVTGTAWFLSGKQALRDGLKLLEAVRREYDRLGRIDPQWNGPLDKAFGPQFRQLLTEWPSSDKELVLFAHFFKDHANRYGMPMPSLEEQVTEGNGNKTTEVILDPEQNRRMVLKLLQLEENILADLQKSLEQRASDSARAQDDAGHFEPRYFPKACRDLERAVDWYQHLKKKKL